MKAMRNSHWQAASLAIPFIYGLLAAIDFGLTTTLMQSSGAIELNPVFALAAQHDIVIGQLLIITAYAALFALAIAGLHEREGRTPQLTERQPMRHRVSAAIIEFLVIVLFVRLFVVLSNYLLLHHNIEPAAQILRLLEALPALIPAATPSPNAIYASVIFTFAVLLLAAYPLVLRVSRLTMIAACNGWNRNTKDAFLLYPADGELAAHD